MKTILNTTDLLQTRGVARTLGRRTVLIQGWLAIFLCVFCVAHARPQASPAESPLDLVVRMSRAEMDAVKLKKHFLYRRSERSSRTKGHLWDELVIEISAGRMHRLIAVDGHPLTSSQNTAEEQRIKSLVQHPEEISRDNQGRQEDESRTNDLLKMLPRAFLFSSEGMENGCIRILFKPNPTYQEQSFQERVIHASGGTLLIHPGDARLCSLDAKLQHLVEFGYGFLGKVSQGSGFKMLREQPTPGQWKTSELHVHIDGNILMMKSVSRQEDSQHFGFEEVPYNMSIEQAATLILSTRYR